MPVEQELTYDGCKYMCYLKEVKGKKRLYPRVFCAKVDKKCSPGQAGIKPYWQMTLSEFIDAYDLQIGDPTVSLAYWYADDKDPNLTKFGAKGVDGHDVVSAKIVGFSQAITGQHSTLVKLQAQKILSHKNVPVDPESKFADKLKGRIGTAPIEEVSYGEAHEKFIDQALREGKSVPQEVLKHYKYNV